MGSSAGKGRCLISPFSREADNEPGHVENTNFNRVAQIHESVNVIQLVPLSWPRFDGPLLSTKIYMGRHQRGEHAHPQKQGSCLESRCKQTGTESATHAHASKDLAPFTPAKISESLFLSSR